MARGRPKNVVVEEPEMVEEEIVVEKKERKPKSAAKKVAKKSSATKERKPRVMGEKYEKGRYGKKSCGVLVPACFNGGYVSIKKLKDMLAIQGYKVRKMKVPEAEGEKSKVSGYILFGNDYRAKHPLVKTGEEGKATREDVTKQMKKIAAEWKKLGKAGKEKWNAKAKK